MADPLSTTIAILSVISIVTKSVVAFSKAIEGLRAHEKKIQDLWNELIALETILLSLDKACESDRDRFSLLVVPLQRCGQACEEFSLVIKKCTIHSDGPKPSIRDWAALRYMGGDIHDFLRLLDGYKMTICIALETVNLRVSQVSAEHILSYQTTISATVKSLGDRLTEMNDKLEALPNDIYQNIVSNKLERSHMLEEKASIQRLIDICLSASQDLKNRQLEIKNTEDGLNETELLRSAKQSTTQTLEKCQMELTNASAGIRAEIYFPDSETSSIEWGGPDINAERRRMEREVESLRQQLAICEESKQFAEQKRQMIFERVSAGNQASQIIASNCEANIVARDIKIGDKTYQVLGQLDGITIQRTSQNHAALLAPHVASSVITPEAQVDSSL